MADARPDRPADDAGASERKRRTRRTLSILAAIGVAPMVASYAFYYLAPRNAGLNYGTLLATGPAPAIAGTADDGAPFRLDELRGRWVVLVAAAASCDAGCERSLYATRQARTMQGKEMERIVRVLALPSNAPPVGAPLLAQHPGLVVVRVAPEAPATLPGDKPGIYVVDPIGNLVMRFGADPDIKGVAKDLGRLLKASGIG